MKYTKFTTAFAKPQILPFTVNSQTYPEHGPRSEKKCTYCVEAMKTFSRGLQRTHCMTEIVYYILYTHVGEFGSAPTISPPPPPGPNHNRSPNETSLLRLFHSQYFPFHKLPNNPQSITNMIVQIASPARVLLLKGSDNFFFCSHRTATAAHGAHNLPIAAEGTGSCNTRGLRFPQECN
jgi:hypothetical protein